MKRLFAMCLSLNAAHILGYISGVWLSSTDVEHSQMSAEALAKWMRDTFDEMNDFFDDEAPIGRNASITIPARWHSDKVALLERAAETADAVVDKIARIPSRAAFLFAASRGVASPGSELHTLILDWNEAYIVKSTMNSFEVVLNAQNGVEHADTFRERITDHIIEAASLMHGVNLTALDLSSVVRVLRLRVWSAYCSKTRMNDAGMDSDLSIEFDAPCASPSSHVSRYDCRMNAVIAKQHHKMLIAELVQELLRSIESALDAVAPNVHFGQEVILHQPSVGEWAAAALTHAVQTRFKPDRLIQIHKFGGLDSFDFQERTFCSGGDWLSVEAVGSADGVLMCSLKMMVSQQQQLAIFESKQNKDSPLDWEKEEEAQERSQAAKVACLKSLCKHRYNSCWRLQHGEEEIESWAEIDFRTFNLSGPVNQGLHEELHNNVEVPYQNFITTQRLLPILCTLALLFLAYYVVPCPRERQSLVSTKCFLPCVAFRCPDGQLVLAGTLQVGHEVVLACGTVAVVVARQFHDAQKVAVVELITRQQSFKVAASQRIAVSNENGLPAGTRQAKELKTGDSIFVGSQERSLTAVRHSEERSQLISISFCPDEPVEAFIIPRFGILARGDPVEISSSGNGMVPENLFSSITEAQLLHAMPTHYEE